MESARQVTSCALRWPVVADCGHLWRSVAFFGSPVVSCGLLWCLLAIDFNHSFWPQLLATALGHSSSFWPPLLAIALGHSSCHSSWPQLQATAARHGQLAHQPREQLFRGIVCFVLLCVYIAYDALNKFDEVWVERKRGWARAASLRSRAHNVRTP